MSDATLDSKIQEAWSDAGLDASTETPNAPDTDTSTEETPSESAPETPEAEPVETPSEETPAETPAETPQEEAQHEKEDDLAAALGLGKPPEDPQERARWWSKRIPYSKLHKIIGERDKKTRESHEAALKEHTEKLTAAEQRMADVAATEEVIRSNPQRFLETLAYLYPDTYGRMFSGEPQQQQNADPMPQPDYDLGNGQWTYSVQGLQKRDEWQARQIEQRVLGTLQRQTQQQRQQAAAMERIEQQSLTNSQTAFQEASAWPMFAENKKAILDSLYSVDKSITDPRAVISSAYLKVVGPKLQANRDSMRADVLKEIKNQPRSTSTSPATPVGKAAAEEQDLDTRIRAAWAKKGLK